MTRKAYDDFAAKKKLPKLKDLEKTFGFHLDADSKIPLIDVMKGMLENLSVLHNRIEEIIYVYEGSPGHVIYENKLIYPRMDDFFEAFKKSNVLKWKYTKAIIDPSDANISDFISSAWKEWNSSLRKTANDLSDMMQKGWRDYIGSEKDESHNYLR